MKRAGIVKGFVAWLAAAGILAAQPLWAVGPSDASSVSDIALREGGVLVGQVVDPQGIPKANLPVTLLAGQQELGVGRTDASGYFAFSGLQGGVYQVGTSQRQETLRVWTPSAAPPAAQPGALIVDGTELARGQFGYARFCLSDPWVYGPLIATAVAVPTAFLICCHPHSP